MKVYLVKYHAGNLASVQNALWRLGHEPIVSDDHTELLEADKLIFPGVGAADSAMAHLRKKGLDQVLQARQKPTLGICLGMQLLAQASAEGPTEGLKRMAFKVQHFPSGGPVPHMGWNSLYDLRGPLFKGIPEQSDVYFVHRYYAPLGDWSSATCDYLLPFSAAVQEGYFYGLQFHPEKSGAVGRQIIQNFIEL